MSVPPVGTIVADASMLITLSKGGLIDLLPAVGAACLLTDIMIDRELKGLLAARPKLTYQPASRDEEEMMRVWTLKRRNKRLSVADASAHVLALRVGRPLLTRDGPLKRCSESVGIRCLDLEWCLDEFARRRVGLVALVAAVGRIQSRETGPDISALTDWVNRFEASHETKMPRRRMGA